MNAVDQLPLKTHNGQPFGLMFMIDGSGKYWWCQYYSHYSKKSDDRLPQQQGQTIEEAASNMVKYMRENYPKMLHKQCQHNSGQLVPDGEGYDVCPNCGKWGEEI
jgi:hypothetical protein